MLIFRWYFSWNIRHSGDRLAVDPAIPWLHRWMSYSHVTEERGGFLTHLLECCFYHDPLAYTHGLRGAYASSGWVLLWGFSWLDSWRQSICHGICPFCRPTSLGYALEASNSSSCWPSSEDVFYLCLTLSLDGGCRDILSGLKWGCSLFIAGLPRMTWA